MLETIQKIKKDADTLKRIGTEEVNRKQIVSDIAEYDRQLANLQVKVDSTNVLRDALIAEIAILDAP